MKLRQIVFIFIIIASITIINNLVQSTYTLWQKQDLVVNARMEAERQKKEEQELKRKLRLIEKPEFVEQTARNKLFLAKPGEGIVVLSQKDLEASNSGKKKIADTRPNWKKWWELFF